MRRYEDIIHLSRPVSETRPRMSMIDRAAQFSPFAALTGYDAAVRETARFTDRRVDLTEQEKAMLDEKLLAFRRGDRVTVTYFLPDDRKEGGAYLTVSGLFVRLDPVQRLLVLEDLAVSVQDIYKIE